VKNIKTRQNNTGCNVTDVTNGGMNRAQLTDQASLYVTAENLKKLRKFTSFS
jgi:hypothetical protein